MKVPYTKAKVTPSDIDAVNNSVRHGWGAKCYDDLIAFEANFAKYVGTKYAVATSSATGALHLGLHALGIGKSDEVILADINWVATVAPLVHLGATPVFIDIDPKTWCIDASKVVDAITPKTRAVIATHIYGNLCDIEALRVVCANNNIYLIEDAAEAIGSYINYKHAGSFGEFGYFSFHGTKTITSGEGGAFVTNDVKLYNKIRELNNHGRHIGEDRQFFANEIGYKFRMSNMQAALVNSQLQRIDTIVEQKRSILEFYKEQLLPNDDITMNPYQLGCENGAWMPTVVFSERSGIRREQIVEHFKKNGIDARTFFWPLTQLPPFKLKPENKISYSISCRAINLPSYLDISKDEMTFVADTLKRLL